MPSIETYRKQAKLLVRWHRERNYSIGEKLRLLKRYRHLTDVEVLAMAMPLTLAQEIVAVEAGFQDWAALKAGDWRPHAAFARRCQRAHPGRRRPNTVRTRRCGGSSLLRGEARLPH